MTEDGSTHAWVRNDDPNRTWDEAAEPAVKWILAESKRRGVRPLLVAPSQFEWGMGADVIRRFAKTYDSTTPRSNSNVSRGRPVIAYVPDYKTFRLAVGYAQGSALAVIETRNSPLIGWAVEVGAVDLISGRSTPDTRSDTQKADMKHIVFNGNNGWTRGFGAESTRGTLLSMQSAGTLDRDLIIGYALARGKNDHAVASLGALIDKVQLSVGRH